MEFSISYGKSPGFWGAQTALPLNGSFALFFRPTPPPKAAAKLTAVHRKALDLEFHPRLLSFEVNAGF